MFLVSRRHAKLTQINFYVFARIVIGVFSFIAVRRDLELHKIYNILNYVNRP